MDIGLPNWFEPTGGNANDVISRPDPWVQLAYHNQTKIGWDRFVSSISCGNLVNQLHRLEEDDFDTEKQGIHIISISLKYFLLMWEKRCSEEHASTDSEIEFRLKTNLLRELAYIQQNISPDNDEDATIVS